ncbi:MAG TPA: amidohydrolase family protein [Candidatus Lustribacter sp.]
MHDHRHAVSRSTFLASAAATATMLLPGAHAFAQAPARRRLIDIHHHYFPPELQTAMAGWQKKHNEPPVGPPVTTWTPEKTLAEMDATGISTAILSLASMHGVWFGADPKSVPGLARTCNEYAAKMSRDHPGRFGMFATLPMPDVGASLKEVAYAFDTLHADGIGIPTSWGDRWPGDSAFDALWAELNRRKAMVVFHPYAPNCCAMLQPGINESYVEYPYDTARTFLSLLFGGTLVKYRDVRWTLVHGGGTLPFLAGRIVNLAANSHAKLDVVAPNGIDYELKRMYYDTANATYAPTMAALIKYIPVSQIMFGTDYPYVTGKQNVGPLESDGLSADDVAAIERGNTMRMIPRLRGTV